MRLLIPHKIIGRKYKASDLIICLPILMFIALCESQHCLKYILIEAVYLHYVCLFKQRTGCVFIISPLKIRLRVPHTIQIHIEIF